LTQGIVFDIKKYALHDGPGIRTTVFFKGCPLRCLWCHNPEGQKIGPELMLRPNRCLDGCQLCLEKCPQGAISKPGAWPLIEAQRCDCCGLCAEVCPSEALEIVGKKMTAAEVMAEVMKDSPFYEESGGGVTFSGGEPLLQPEFLVELLELSQKNRLSTTVDTSGYAPFKVFERIWALVDLFLYDLKLMDPERHRLATGLRNEIILENLRRLAHLTDKIVIRLPVIPSINDDEANLVQMASFIASLPPLKGIELLPYHSLGKEKYTRLGRTYQLAELKKPSLEAMEKIARFFNETRLPISIGG